MASHTPGDCYRKSPAGRCGHRSRLWGKSWPCWWFGAGHQPTDDFAGPVELVHVLSDHTIGHSVGWRWFDVSGEGIAGGVGALCQRELFPLERGTGQVFLTDALTVTNPSGGHVENLSDFDDLSSGLADSVDFVMSASNAAMAGDSSACGARHVYPPSLCPISLGQGLTVDTDTANHDDRAVVQLPPGSSTQIVLSYGPVAASLQPATVSAYFDDGNQPRWISPHDPDTAPRRQSTSAVRAGPSAADRCSKAVSSALRGR